MSLQSTVYNLNNNLISSFATLDSWYDRDQGFLEGDIHLTTNPLKTIQDVLVVNAFILSFFRIENKDRQNNFTDVDRFYSTVKPGHEIDLVTLIPDHVKRDFQEKFYELTHEEARSLIRDQLFYFLCILDEVHDHRLDVHDGEPLHARSGLELLQVFSGYLSRLVQKWESKLEWTSPG